MLLRDAVAQQRLAAIDLVRVLHLDPSVDLVPRDSDLVPITVVDTTTSADSLIARATRARPELRRAAAVVDASEASRRGAMYGAWFPSVGVQGFAGALGGGPDSGHTRIAGMSDYTVSIGWRLGPGGLFDAGRINAANTQLSTAKLNQQKTRESVAADVLCLGLAQLATISERRSDRLVNPSSSGLPAFLTRHGGLQSGLMMAQVTAAALTSELKTVGHPASVDTIPTSGNTEDHVSMSMAAALKAMRALELARRVIAIEMLCACQAIDLLAPLRTSPPLARAHDFIRTQVPLVDADRSTSRDLANITRMIASGELHRACGAKVN